MGYDDYQWYDDIPQEKKPSDVKDEGKDPIKDEGKEW